MEGHTWIKATHHAVAEPLADRVEAALDRHYRVVALVCCSVWFVSTAASSYAKPFWHDELDTILIARLPSFHAVWSAIQAHADLSAPLNTLLTHGVHALFGIGRLTMRLPALTGTALMIAALFLFVRRRTGTSLAIAAAVLPSYTAAYRYAYEARGYGLMMGFFALALYGWAEAARGRRRALHIPVMVMALSAGYWSHYFAVFALVPICAGEIVRLVRERRADVTIWAAAGASLLALVPLADLLGASRHEAPSFWRHAVVADISETYAFVFNSLLNWWVIFGALLALGFAAFARWRPSAAPASRRLPMHEAAAIVACLLLPVVEVIAAMMTTGVFVPRYALPLVVGVGLGLPLAIWRIGRDARGDMAFALVVAISFGITGYRALRNAPAAYVDPIDGRPLLGASLREPKPVVVTGGLMFLQLWYYTPPELRGRLWYLADPEAAIKRTGSATIDRGLLALAKWTPVNVSDYASFVNRYDGFRVYTAGSGWLLNRLEGEDCVIEQVGAELGGRLLVVRCPR
jgi:Dolichyl-phosphate-mannose-protein mannosyltransferase